MSTRYPNHSSQSGDPVVDSTWPIAQGLFACILFLICLPALLVGVIAHRLTSTHAWSFPLWFLLLFPSALLGYVLYQHGLEQLIFKELTDYIQAIKLFHTDFARWNWKLLWNDTWPVWVHTLVAVPLVGFWQEVSTNARGGNTLKQLQQKERRRQRAMERHKNRARKRTRRPEHLPDAVGGMMVIGVPIRDEKE